MSLDSGVETDQVSLESLQCCKKLGSVQENREGGEVGDTTGQRVEVCLQLGVDSE